MTSPLHDQADRLVTEAEKLRDMADQVSLGTFTVGAEPEEPPTEEVQAAEAKKATK